LGLKDAAVFNTWAWYVVRFPGRDAKSASRALTWAQKAVALAPKVASYWNTLGVASYRVEEWKAAIRALKKSEELAPGQHLGWNAFFLAMAHWRLGEKEPARKEYEHAVQWMEKN